MTQSKLCDIPVDFEEGCPYVGVDGALSDSFGKMLFRKRHIRGYATCNLRRGVWKKS